MAYTTNTASNRQDMSATRPYLYSLGKKYGMSNSDVDKLIGWDNDTKQVSFGGKVIGTPDALGDGVSYWKDTSKLDTAFNDYISRSGTARTPTVAVSQENDGLFAKYNQEYEDLKNTNPFETEVGKSILAKYDLSGLQARDNAVASGSASNGGNIDSYAAANALRQQASLVSQGQQAALDAHQQKIDNVRGLLSDMGVNIDRVFNQDQTAKNNEIARAEVEAGITGTVPVSLEIKNNMYLNEDGTIKDQYKDIDFYTVMQNAKAAGNEAGYNQAAVARYYKIMNDYGLYGQYDDGNYLVPGGKQTEAGRQFDENQKTVQKTLETESADNRYVVDANNKNALDQINANTQGQKDILTHTAELNSAPSDQFTSDQIKQVDNVVKTINNALKNHKSNPNGIDLVNYSVNGKYSFNPTPQANKATYWREFIIPIIYNSGLTAAERTLLYSQLGFSKKDVEDVYAKKGYLDDQQ